MKIAAGKTNLYIVVSSLEKLIDRSKEYENINHLLHLLRL